MHELYGTNVVLVRVRPTQISLSFYYSIVLIDVLPLFIRKFSNVTIPLCIYIYITVQYESEVGGFRRLFHLCTSFLLMKGGQDLSRLITKVTSSFEIGRAHV